LQDGFFSQVITNSKGNPGKIKGDIGFGKSKSIRTIIDDIR
jgi:hypothetical protein